MRRCRARYACPSMRAHVTVMASLQSYKPEFMEKVGAMVGVRVPLAVPVAVGAATDWEGLLLATLVQEGLGLFHTPPLRLEDCEAVLDVLGVLAAETEPRTPKYHTHAAVL